MKFSLHIHKTPLIIAIEYGRTEMVKFLLSQPDIDVNLELILEFFFNLYDFIFLFNSISK